MTETTHARASRLYTDAVDRIARLEFGPYDGTTGFTDSLYALQCDVAAAGADRAAYLIGASLSALNAARAILGDPDEDHDGGMNETLCDARAHILSRAADIIEGGSL